MWRILVTLKHTHKHTELQKRSWTERFLCSDLKRLSSIYVHLLEEPILEHKILFISVQNWLRIKYKVSGWIPPVD